MAAEKNQTSDKKVSDTTPTYTRGDLVWAHMVGRGGKPTAVRARVEDVTDELLQVELYYELQLPVPFVKNVLRQDVERV